MNTYSDFVKVSNLIDSIKDLNDADKANLCDLLFGKFRENLNLKNENIELKNKIYKARQEVWRQK